LEKKNTNIIKDIVISTDIRKFYKQYLNIIKPLLPQHISTGELNLLAELLYFENKYKDLEQSIRSKLVFDHDTKIDIMSNLDISYNTFGNLLSSLRTKDYIKGRIIKQSLLVHPTDSYSINYTFKIK